MTNYYVGSYADDISATLGVDIEQLPYREHTVGIVDDSLAGVIMYAHHDYALAIVEKLNIA